MLKDIDFKYCVVYDFTIVKDCHAYGCHEEGICRCSTIENETIQSISYKSVINKIYDFYFDDEKSTNRNNIINSLLYGIGQEIDIYTIDRILRINKMWENHNWNINICGGYYGEEIDSVTIKEDIAIKMSKEIEDCFSLDLSGRIEYLLNLEYHRILPELIGCKYEFININKEDIFFSSQSQYNIVRNSIIEYYYDNKYNGIRGIVISDDDKYRLIDGYHRCYATNKDTLSVLRAYK